MKIKKLLMLLMCAVIALGGTVSAADDEAIRVEAEDYSASPLGTQPSTVAELSEKKGILVNTPVREDAWFEYSVSVPKTGTYKMKAAISVHRVTYTTPVLVSINGGAEQKMSKPTLIEKIDCAAFPDVFKLYDFGNWKMNEGTNTVRIRLDPKSPVYDKSYLLTYMDYFEFKPVTEKFFIKSITGVTDAPNVFEQGTAVKLEWDFSTWTSEDTNVIFNVVDALGYEVRKGTMTFKKGTDKYVLNIGALDIGWYRLSFDGVDIDGDVKYHDFSVVKPLSKRKSAKESPIATDAAASMWLQDINSFEKHVRALNYAGINVVRDRHTFGASASVQNAKQFAYQNIYDKYGITVVYNSGSFGSQESRVPPTDLFDSYQMGRDAVAATKDAKIEPMFELMNEMDALTFSPLTGQQYASFYKAASIGISDESSSAIKMFGGLATAVDLPFCLEMFQNGVWDYSDAFAHHIHSGNSTRKKDTQNYNMGRAMGHTEYNNAFGGNKPLYITEAGYRLEVEKDGRPNMESMLSQARYAIVAMSQSLAVGDDKPFWFLWAHYMENGGEWGTFSEKLTPYTSYNAIAALTDALGEGIYKGPLANLPKGASGYMFNDGKNDVAVVWCDTADRYQVFAEKNVTVIDFMGKETVKEPSQCYDRLVNLPISYYPIFIKFNGESDVRNYYPENHIIPTAVSTTFDKADRVVIQQLWEDQVEKESKNTGYHLKIGKPQNITVSIYNFNSNETVRGAVSIRDSSQALELSGNTINFKIEPMQKYTFSLEITPTEMAKGGVNGYLIFEGALEDGAKISQAVSKYVVDDDNRIVTDVVNFEYEEPSAWYLKNTSPAEYTNSKTETEGELRFDLKFTTADRWAYPWITIGEGTIPKDSQGICFWIKALEADSRCNVFLYSKDWSYFLGDTNYVEYGTEWKQVIIPWKKLVMYSSKDGMFDVSGFHPEMVERVSIGGNFSTNTPSPYVIKDFGYYYSDAPADKDTSAGPIIIEGVSASAHYKEGANIIADVTLPEDNYKKINVMLNEENIEFEQTNDSKLKVELSSMKRGFYKLHISTINDCYLVNYTVVSFYVD